MSDALTIAKERHALYSTQREQALTTMRDAERAVVQLDGAIAALGMLIETLEAGVPGDGVPAPQPEEAEA